MPLLRLTTWKPQSAESAESDLWRPGMAVPPLSTPTCSPPSCHLVPTLGRPSYNLLCCCLLSNVIRPARWRGPPSAHLALLHLQVTFVPPSCRLPVTLQELACTWRSCSRLPLTDKHHPTLMCLAPGAAGQSACWQRSSGLREQGTCRGQGQSSVFQVARLRVEGWVVRGPGLRSCVEW